MIAKSLARLTKLGLADTMPEFERKWHELANLFTVFIFFVIAAYNVFYIVMGAWLLWALNGVVLLMIGASFGLLAAQRIVAARLLFVLATAVGVASLAVGLGPDSNLQYMAFLACLVVPLLVPGGLGFPKIAAFATAAAAYFVAVRLHALLPITPPFPAKLRAWIEDSCLLICTTAIAYTIMRLMDFLAASNRNMDALLRALPDPWLRVSKDGDILQRGGGSLEQDGRSAAESLAVLFPEQVWRQMLEDMKKASDLQQTIERTIAVPTPTRESGRYLDCRIRSLSQEDCLILFRDRTESVVNEDLERDRQAKMFHSSRLATLGEMAAGIAHEINSPLAVIDTSTESLQRFFTKTGLVNESCDKTLKRIRKTVMRIAKTVQGLRSFARDGGADPMESTQVSTIVEDTLELCRQRVRNAGVTIDINSPEHDMMIVCRPVQISQVLLNLINNAHQAVASLEDRWILVTVRELATECQISVTDSGPGIPAETRAKLFQPFFTTKRTGEGTGLGLSISRSIMEQHGGSLSLDETSPNTCFVLTLPKQEATQSRQDQSGNERAA